MRMAFSSLSPYIALLGGCVRGFLGWGILKHAPPSPPGALAYYLTLIHASSELLSDRSLFTGEPDASAPMYY